MDDRRMTVSDWKAKFERARSAYRSMQGEVQESTQRGIEGVLMVSGGAAVGLMRGIWGDPTTGDVKLPGIDFEADIILSLGLQTAAVLGLPGKQYSNLLNSFAGGMSAAVAAREIEAAMRKPKAK